MIDRLPEAMETLTMGRVRLRPLGVADAEGRYVAWMNDPEIVRFTESRFRTYSVSDIASYIESLRVARDSVFMAIETLAARHIGNIKLGPINWDHRSAYIGLIIGERDCWGQGYGSEAISCIARHAFASLGLFKLNAGVYGPNVGCIKAFAKSGFVQEGQLRDQCWLDGQPVDVVLMGRVNRSIA